MAEPILPTSIARYQVKRALGEGGMGMVYLAEDPILKRRLAIKVVKEVGEARNQGFLRFRREAEISAQLNHPNVVMVFDVGVDPEVGPFLAMEYVEGKSLAQHMKDKDLDLETLAKALIQAGWALRAAHRQAIVHRDVKPENILWAENGRAKLMDFGIARALATGAYQPEPSSERTVDPDDPNVAHTIALRLTQVGEFIGSPAYACQELLLGQEATPSSDRYAFAATAFEMLTGDLPHPGNSVTAIIQHILRKPPAIPKDMDPRLAKVFLQALAFDPEERYPTLVDFLEAFVDALPVPVHQKARLFTLLSQDEDAQSGSIRRALADTSFQLPKPVLPQVPKGKMPIHLHEDVEEEKRWHTGKMRVHNPRRPEGWTSTYTLVKWLIYGLLGGIVVSQLFWIIWHNRSHQ
jgi:serine/threonine protein kinase